MSLDILPHLVSGLALAVVGWAWNGMKALRATVHDLELRQVRTETQTSVMTSAQAELKVAVGDLRENMVRRADLDATREALCQRIDDLRRS